MIDSSYSGMRKVFDLKHKIKIISASAVGGEKEKKGPLGQYIDIYCDDADLKQDSWEKAENEMCRLALNTALAKADLADKNLDILLAGDLMNQCSGTGYGLCDFDVPYFGLYGACSTMVQGIMTGALLIDSGHINSCAVVVSSHFCSAERQYRYPLAYGSFSETTSQHTVTGAGAFVLSIANDDEEGVFVTECLPGIVTDRGIKDAGNMGAAMAPAAADTITRYILDRGKEKISKTGMILTGDLGTEGKALTTEFLRTNNIELGEKYNDCGVMIYDTKKQDVGCGGSGCGCSAVVTAGYLFNMLSTGKINSCAIAGTGAMMSPQDLLQGKTIPAIAHLIKLEGAKK